jgi:hypothetical protein
LGIADKRFKTSVGHAVAAMATGRPKAAVEISGIDDMETSGFQGTSGLQSDPEAYIRFLFAIDCSTAGQRLSSI